MGTRNTAGLTRKKITVHGRKGAFQRSVMVRSGAKKPGLVRRVAGFINKHQGKIAAGLAIGTGAALLHHRIKSGRARAALDKGWSDILAESQRQKAGIGAAVKGAHDAHELFERAKANRVQPSTSDRERNRRSN